MANSATRLMHMRNCRAERWHLLRRLPQRQVRVLSARGRSTICIARNVLPTSHFGRAMRTSRHGSTLNAPVRWIGAGWAGKERSMAFEDKEAELGLLLGKMQAAPLDMHELYQQIRQKLAELRAYGMPLPADLVEFERDLEAEFTAEAESGKEDEMRRERLQQVVSRRGRR